MSETRIISVVFGKGKDTTTSARYRYDYGQIIEVVGTDLPETFEARFSNSPSGESIRVIGTQNKVSVPDELFLSGEPIYCYITVNDSTTDGRTVYLIKIPVKNSTERTDADPTPVEQDIITQAIASLNDAVDKTSQNVEITNENAESSMESAENARVYAESASESAENANASATNAESSAEMASGFGIQAESSATVATQKASEASASASEAMLAMQEAKQSADKAEQAASQSGYMHFYIDEHGDLIYHRTSNVQVDFYLHNGDIYMRGNA